MLLTARLSAQKPAGTLSCGVSGCSSGKRFLKGSGVGIDKSVGRVGAVRGVALGGAWGGG